MRAIAKSTPRPNLFIVGAPRCGTSSLWAYLKSHPDIFMSKEKELYFFDTDLHDRGGISTEDYLRHFSRANGHKKIGEASPSYLRSERACHAIQAFSPDAQIIIMLRNPVDVLYSLHAMALYGSEPITDFAAALEGDAARSGRGKIGYREFTEFPKQVRRYFDRFGRENVHVIVYDDLIANSAGVGRETLRFLGVRDDISHEFPWANSNKEFRIPRLEQILCQPSANLRRLIAWIPRRLRRRTRHGISRLNGLVRPRPPMDPRTRRRLQAEFAPEVDQLSGLLGRDLSGWYGDH